MNPGDIILNGSLLAAMPLAVLAGLISFLSPCVLPLVPGYLGFVSGAAGSGEKKSRSRIILGAALFVAGFTFVFVSLGAAFGGLGTLIQSGLGEVIQRILGALIIILGLVLVGQFGFMQRTFKMQVSPRLGLARLRRSRFSWSNRARKWFGKFAIAGRQHPMHQGHSGRQLELPQRRGCCLWLPLRRRHSPNRLEGC